MLLFKKINQPGAFMRRLFRVKNMFALASLLGILAIVLRFIVTGWVDFPTHLAQGIMVSVLGYYIYLNIKYRQEHDPVRQFCVDKWDRFC